MEEIFNLGIDSRTNQEIKPRFEDFTQTLAHQVESYKYDNERARKRMDPDKVPTAQEQKSYMQERLEDFKFDFMPK